MISGPIFQCANLLGVYEIAYFSGWPILEIFSGQTLHRKKYSDDLISIYVHDITI